MTSQERTARARATPHREACPCPVCCHRRGLPAPRGEARRAADLDRKVTRLLKAVAHAEKHVRQARATCEALRPGSTGTEAGKPVRQPGQSMVEHWAEVKAWKAAGSPAA